MPPAVINATLHSLRGFFSSVNTGFGVSGTKISERIPSNVVNFMDILQRVRKVLNANEELEQLLYDVQGLEVGSLTIGAFSSIAVNWLPQIVGSFKHAHPNIAISLKEGGTAELHKWIQEQQVDFAFCNPLKNQTAEFIPLKTDEFVAIFPADYPLDPTLTAYPLENLTGQPFILSEPSYDYSTTDMLRENGVAPDILFSSRNDYAIM